MKALSVIVPTYNREANLASCLRAIRASRQGGNVEVVVSDDGGHLDLELLCQKFQARLIQGPNQGPAAARNRGAAAASGDVIVFLDDDCQVMPDCLERLHSGVLSMERCVVGGHCVNGLPHNPFSETSQRITNGLIRATSGSEYPFLPTCVLGLRRSSFESIGRFDESFPLAAGEDRAFCRVATEKGHSLRQVSEARVTHYHHLGLKSFLRQHYRYGKGARRFEEAFGGGVLLDRGQRWRLLSHCLAPKPVMLHWPLRAFAFGLSQCATKAGYHSSSTGAIG
ncbi:MAG: glycosyltransferase [Opitutales bacterium]